MSECSYDIGVSTRESNVFSWFVYQEGYPWPLVQGPFQGYPSLWCMVLSWGIPAPPPKSLVPGPSSGYSNLPIPGPLTGGVYPVRTRSGISPWTGPGQGYLPPPLHDTTRHGQDTLRGVRLLRSRKRTFL